MTRWLSARHGPEDRGLPSGLRSGLRRDLARTVCTTLLASTALAAAAAEGPDAERFAATVWAKARFEPDGTVGALEFSSMAEHPAAFLEALRPLLLRARIPPPLDGDLPAVFETGLKVSVLVDKDPAASGFRVLGLVPHPLPVRVFAPTRRWRDSGGREVVQRAMASCTVTVQGRCGRITVTPEGPVAAGFEYDVVEAFRRWVFEPQKLNGQPIEGAASMRFSSATR